MELTSLDSALANAAALPPAPDAPPPPGFLSRAYQDVTAPDFAGRLGENFSAAGKRVLDNDISFGGSDAYVMSNQYEPIVEALNKVQQRQPKGWFTPDYTIRNPFSEVWTPPPDFTGDPRNRQDRFNFIWGQVEKARGQYPGVFGQLPKDQDEVVADTQAEQRAAIGAQNTLAQKSGPITGGVGQFAGEGAAGFTDPVNIVATALGFPASESLLRTALIEGGANAMLDAVGLPGRYQHYQDIGEPMTGGDVATELASSAAFGSALGVGGKLLARVLGLKGHALADEFDAKNPDPTPGQKTAVAMVRAEADLKASNPFEAGPAGEDLHRQALVQAQGALNDRAPAAMPDLQDHVAPVAMREVTPGEIAAALEDVKARAAAAPKEPSLFNTIRELGGIKMQDEAGKPTMGAQEIRQIMDTNHSLANNATGLAPDTMREALAERGWFGGNRDTAQSDLNDFRALIDREARGGKVYHPEPAIHGDLAYRQLLDREQTEAGITAADSQDVAARKLAEFRVSQGHDLAAAHESAAHQNIQGLSPGALEALYSHGYEPGSDFGAEFETGAGGQQPGGAGQAPGRETLAGGPPGGAEGAGATPGRAQVPGEARGQLAQAEIKASNLTHTRATDPEALKRFSDPLKKPDAFTQQANDLARALFPPPEKIKGDVIGPKESVFGPAQFQIEALQRADQNIRFADPATGTETTVKAERGEIERQARAVERLRGCIEGKA